MATRSTLVVTLALTAALATVASACTAKAPAPAPPPSVNTDARPAPTPAAPESAFGADGVLKPDPSPIFDAPVPVASEPEFAEKGLAALAPSHSYADLKTFFEKNLDAKHQLVDQPGGFKVLPRSGDGTRIYVSKPRRLGTRPQVLYFGDPNTDELPESLRKSVVDHQVGGGAGGGGSAAGAEPAATPERPRAQYTEKVETGADGKKVVVWEPVDARPGDSDPSGAQAQVVERKSVGKARIKIDIYEK